MPNSPTAISFQFSKFLVFLWISFTSFSIPNKDLNVNVYTFIIYFLLIQIQWDNLLNMVAELELYE